MAPNTTRSVTEPTVMMEFGGQRETHERGFLLRLHRHQENEDERQDENDKGGGKACDAFPSAAAASHLSTSLRLK
jgi:hypothetical protein